jgi:hypothetical protein
VYVCAAVQETKKLNEPEERPRRLRSTLSVDVVSNALAPSRSRLRTSCCQHGQNKEIDAIVESILVIDKGIIDAVVH